MAKSYYKPCKELDICDQLIKKYFQTGQYELCFVGHMVLAELGYPLAECQVGYFYLEGLGVEKDVEKAFAWTEKAAQDGDWDAQFNLAWFYEEGTGTARDMAKARYWYEQAAKQGHDEAIVKCREWKTDGEKDA